MLVNKFIQGAKITVISKKAFKKKHFIIITNLFVLNLDCE
jgi:hypothetical protein